MDKKTNLFLICTVCSTPLILSDQEEITLQYSAKIVCTYCRKSSVITDAIKEEAAKSNRNVQ